MFDLRKSFIERMQKERPGSYPVPVPLKDLSNKASQEGLLTKETNQNLAFVLSKYEKRMRLPRFKGIGKIQGLFEKIGSLLSDRGWSSGTDKFLGNS